MELNFLDEEEDENIDSSNNNIQIESDELKGISNQIFNYYNRNKEDINISLNMFNFSKLCRIFRILYYKYGKEYKDDIFEISKFLASPKDRSLKLNKSFVEKIINEQKFSLKILDDNETFFYRESDELTNFFVLFYICFITHTHICIEGNTGVGKTACAKALSKILKENHDISNYVIFSFHKETEPNDFYGTLTINKNNLIFCKGSLTNSFISNNIFIADELNLTSDTTMNSIGPILEEHFNCNIYIPGLSERMKINKNFFFVCCQNFSTVLGRKQLPNLLKRRIKFINYPDNSSNSFQNICVNINKKICEDYNKNNVINDEDAKKFGIFIQKFNEINTNILYNLNLRDIKKIFKRIYYQEDNKKDYQGFNHYFNIFFYILGQTKSKDKNNLTKKLIPLLAEIFNDSNDLVNQKNKIFIMLEKCLESKTELVEIEEENKKNIYLIKDKCKINVNSLITLNMDIYKNLNTFLESLFFAKLTLTDEPILLLGQRGYKTYLANLLFSNNEIIDLIPETKINQLLGASLFLNKRDSILFYLKHFFNMTLERPENEKKFIKFETTIDSEGKIKNNEDKQFILKCLENVPNEEKQRLQICNNLFEKIFDFQEYNFLENLKLVFNPSIITKAYLWNRNLILKNISNLDTSILERFNEFFSEYQTLTLNEDIHQTFTDKENKTLKLKNIRIIATSNPGYENKISETISSRFTIIEVNLYEKKEEDFVLRLYSKENNLLIEEKDYEIIEDFCIAYSKGFNDEISLNQKLIFLKIISNMNKNKNNINNKNNNTNLAIYMIIKGILNDRANNITKLKNILNDINIDNYKDNDKILKIEDKNIVSQNTKLSLIKVENQNNSIDEKIYLSKEFCELVDIIHFSIFNNIGLIIEGENGQGKKTAINYISNILGYKVLNIYLNEITKIEELIGSMAIEKDKTGDLRIKNIETDFVKTLLNKEYSIIVFHNINKASFAIIEQIANLYKKICIFDCNGNKKYPKYDNLFFISLFSNEKGIKGKEYLLSKKNLNHFYLREKIKFLINYLMKLKKKKWN